MTKRTYIIKTFGYGGEVVMGNVNKASYDYFEDNSIDLSEYAADSDNDLDISEEVQPFAPGAWYECDDLFHECSTEMCDKSYISVEDKNGNEVWKSYLTSDELSEAGCEMKISREVYASEQEVGSVLFFGRSIEKGEFFTGEIEIASEFDPKLLKITCVDVEGLELLEKLEYDGSEINNSCDGSSMTKDSHFEFIVT